jgi:hypothetical protein
MPAVQIPVEAHVTFVGLVDKLDGSGYVFWAGNAEGSAMGHGEFSLQSGAIEVLKTVVVPEPNIFIPELLVLLNEPPTTAEQFVKEATLVPLILKESIVVKHEGAPRKIPALAIALMGSVPITFMKNGLTFAVILACAQLL